MARSCTRFASSCAAELSVRTTIRARLRHPRTAAVVIVLAAALAGCGGAGTEPGGFTYESTLTIYSGLPLQGPLAPEMRSIVDGEILALAQAGGRVGHRPISFASLNDVPANGDWDGKEPRAAGQDLDAIAYIGDFESAATAVSLPILGENDILQVSPGSPYVGFTDATPFDQAGEPESYYPSGKDTFARLIPSDVDEAAATAGFMRDEHVKRLYVLSDTASVSDPYDSVIAAMVARDARASGLAVNGPEALDTAQPDFAALIAAIAASHADAVFLGAAPDPGAERLWTELHAALPGLRLFAPSTLATPAFLAATAQSAGATYVTSPILPLAQYPVAARAVLRAYAAKFGTAPTALSLYGYEAMQSVLAALAHASDPADRLDVLKAYFQLGWRDSVIGRYRIEPSGDTTLSRFAGYRVGHAGKLIELRSLTG